MTKTVTIQLPDHLVEQLQLEAEKQNVSVENLIVQSLAVTFSPPDQTTHNGTIDDRTITDDLTNLLTLIGEAKQAGRTTIEIVETPVTLKFSQIMQALGFITEVQSLDNGSSKRLKITLPLQRQHQASKLTASVIDQLLFSDQLRDVPPDLAQILQSLNNNDPNVRVQAMEKLGELYSGQS